MKRRSGCVIEPESACVKCGKREGKFFSFFLFSFSADGRFYSNMPLPPLISLAWTFSNCAGLNGVEAEYLLIYIIPNFDLAFK